MFKLNLALVDACDRLRGGGDLCEEVIEAAGIFAGGEYSNDCGMLHDMITSDVDHIVVATELAKIGIVKRTLSTYGEIVAWSGIVDRPVVLRACSLMLRTNLRVSGYSFAEAVIALKRIGVSIGDEIRVSVISGGLLENTDAIKYWLNLACCGERIVVRSIEFLKSLYSYGYEIGALYDACVGSLVFELDVSSVCNFLARVVEREACELTGRAMRGAFCAAIGKEKQLIETAFKSGSWNNQGNGELALLTIPRVRISDFEHWNLAGERAPHLFQMFAGKTFGTSMVLADVGLSKTYVTRLLGADPLGVVRAAGGVGGSSELWDSMKEGILGEVKRLGLGGVCEYIIMGYVKDGIKV
jgi:hypothetical protein